MLGFLSSAGRPLHSDSWEEKQRATEPPDLGVSTGDKTVTEAEHGVTPEAFLLETFANSPSVVLSWAEALITEIRPL